MTWWGKVATFGLYFAFPGLLLGVSDHGSAEVFLVIGWVLVAPSLLYSYLSAIEYVPLARRALRQGRLDREADRRG